jgi:hypothetical protein
MDDDERLREMLGDALTQRGFLVGLMRRLDIGK